MHIVLLHQVENFFGSLTEKEIAKVIRTIELLEEFGSNLGMPHSRHMSGGLLELRIRGKREVRIFYCFHKEKVFLLHACIKKTEKTLDKELKMARLAKEGNPSHLRSSLRIQPYFFSKKVGLDEAI